MFYFRFQIPTNKDGSVATYSPGWCGTRDKCALNEKGLLYNDKERWGIGQAEGDFVPPDVEVLTKEQVISVFKTQKYTGVVTSELTGIENTVEIDASKFDIDIKDDGTVEFSIDNLEAPTIKPAEEQVYFGDKLARRYDPEVLIEDKAIDDLSAGEPVVTKKAVFCPVCHQFIMWLPENITAKTINLTCKNGHQVVLTSEVSNV